MIKNNSVHRSYRWMASGAHAQPNVTSCHPATSAVPDLIDSYTFWQIFIGDFNFGSYPFSVVAMRHVGMDWSVSIMVQYECKVWSKFGRIVCYSMVVDGLLPNLLDINTFFFNLANRMYKGQLKQNREYFRYIDVIILINLLLSYISRQSGSSSF